MSEPKKLPVSELLRLACIYAEQDREAFAMAVGEGQERQEADQFIEQVRAYRRKRWGRAGCDMVSDAMRECRPVSVYEVAKRKGDRPFRFDEK
jgi:hypothetical protein